MKTVLFDMDGTLLDTEKIYQKAWKEAAAEFGICMSTEQGLAMRSLGKPFAEPHFRKMLGEAADYYKIRDRRKVIEEKVLVENGIPLKPHAAETLAKLKVLGYRVAVVTATGEERAYRYLKSTQLYDYFDDIICATMVKQGKPEPDVYLYACERLNVNPNETFAVEDSPNGVRSAYAAGCKVIMIPDLSQPDSETEKLLYKNISNLSKLIDVL